MDDRVVGIDLGTSNSVISTIINGEPVVIADADEETIHPSIVSFLPDGSVLVGKRAKKKMRTDPAHTIYSAKRLVGRPFFAREITIASQSYAYEVVRGEDDNPRIQIYDRILSIEEVQAMVLRHLRKLAEDYLGEPVTKAVITVPANFSESQRLATKNAGEIAGLEVLRILNEPTAAALAYGYKQSIREQIAVYDLGGGTFDITLLELRDNVFEVLSTAGNTFLGGDDFDDQIVYKMLSTLKKKYEIDLSKNNNQRQRLRSYAEELKITLTDNEKASIMLKIPQPGSSSPLEIPFSITRSTFNTLGSRIVQSTFLVCDEALKLARLNSDQIDRLVLVGGATKIPLVRTMVEKYFFKKPLRDINPDEVVSVGAAIYAHSLSGANNRNIERSVTELEAEDLIDDEPLLIDVTSRGLSIATVGGFTEMIIPRNMSVPTRSSKQFTNSYDGQTQVRLRVFEGDTNREEESRLLGELYLLDLPASDRGSLQLEVTFQINADGMVEVSAKDLKTQIEQKVRLNVSGELDSEEKEAARSRSKDEVELVDLDDLLE